MRKSKLIEYNGKKQSLEDWAKETGLTYPCLVWRLRNGWSIKQALTTPSARTPRKMRITEKQQKEIFMPIQKKVDYTQCKTCQYRSTISSGGYPNNIMCGYALVNDRCRSLISPPSPNCTVYIKGPSLVRAAALKKARRGAWG